MPVSGGRGGGLGQRLLHHSLAWETEGGGRGGRRQEGVGRGGPHNPSSESGLQNPEQLMETLRMRDRGGGYE